MAAVFLGFPSAILWAADTVDDFLNPEEGLKRCYQELAENNKILIIWSFAEQGHLKDCGANSLKACEERRDFWLKWLKYNQDKLGSLENEYKAKYDMYLSAKKNCEASWSLPGYSPYWCQKRDEYLTELNEMIEFRKSTQRAVKSNQEAVTDLTRRVDFIKKYGSLEEVKSKSKDIETRCETLRLLIKKEPKQTPAVAAPQGPEFPSTPSPSSSAPMTGSSGTGSKYDKYVRPMSCERACQTACSAQPNDPGCYNRCLKERCNK